MRLSATIRANLGLNSVDAGVCFAFRLALIDRLALVMASSCFATHTAWILHKVKRLSKGRELDIMTGGRGVLSMRQC